MQNKTPIFPWALRVTIPVIVLVFFLAYDVVRTCLVYQVEKKEILQREKSITLRRAHFLRECAEYFLTRGAGTVLGLPHFSTLKEDPSLIWSAIIDDTGVIRYSKNIDWIGKHYEKVLPEDSQKMVELGVKNPLGMIKVLWPHRIFVLELASGLKMRTNGWVVVLERDISDELYQARKYALREGVTSATLHTLFCVFLWCLLHIWFSKRISTLLNQTRTLPVKVDSSQDEFNQLFDAFQQSYGIFQQLVENIRAVIYLMSGDRRELLYVSPTFEDIWGFTIPTPSRNGLELLNDVIEEDHHRVINMMEPLYHGAKSVHCEYRMRRRDSGKLRWFESRAFPILNEDGTLIRIVGITLDITERKLLEQEVLDIAETERRRVGHDLHDDLCQRLAAVKLRIEILSDRIQNADPSKTVQEVNALALRVGEAATLARNLARGLAPVNLETEEFVHYLRKMVRSSESIYNVKINFDAPDELMIKDSAVAINLYRITQELINNAAKHAMPKFIKVKIEVMEQQLELSVENDGLPFDGTLGPEREDGGMGLRIIRYRANALGGCIKYQSRQNDATGTLAVCTIPFIANK